MKDIQATGTTALGEGLKLLSNCIDNEVTKTTPETKGDWKPLVFINPKITKASKKKAIVQEGCLSVRWIYGKTERATNVTIEAYDENGNKFSYGASSLIAHIFQHEMDHLDGVLFTDIGFDFEEFTEEEIREANKTDKK